MIRRLVGAHSECRADVVLETGAAPCRKIGVVVDEHLHLTFAVPDEVTGFGEDTDADVATEEPTGPDESVGDDEVLTKRRRVLAPESRVQQADVVRDRSQREVELVVELDATRRSIDQFDPDRIPERHRNPRVEPATFRRALECRRVRDRASVHRPEEVGHRDRDARFGSTVVEHFEHERAELVRRARDHGHPEVTETARTIEVREGDALLGVDEPPRRTLAAVMGSARTSGAPGRILERHGPGWMRKVDQRRVGHHLIHGRAP